MSYIVQNIDVATRAVVGEQVFEQVALTPDKQFVSEIAVEDGIASDVEAQEVKLYVLGSDGQPEQEVLSDGNGTEVPIEAPPASCEHEYTTAVTAPTCTERGYTAHTCSKCDNSYTDSYTAALGHNYGAWTVIAPATSTVSGQQERVCSRCGDKQTNVIPATGSSSNTPNDRPSSSGSSSGSDYTPTIYSITVPTVVGGTISISPKSAAKGAVVTITATPDTGYTLASLIVKEQNSKTVALTDKGNDKYTFAMPSGKVTVDASFELIQTTIPSTETMAWSNPFTDVATDAWYYDAVKFVNEAGLMNGTSSSIFAPDASLSRAMLAQILYNKEGHPAATGNNAFTDVESGAWYADAVTWAAERGIVGGYGNGLFGPGDNITREQLAVMLWRYAGEPSATDRELHFTDADTVSNYAVEALLWATENGIINGKGIGILDPGGQATRAQVAQMLKNYLDK